MHTAFSLAPARLHVYPPLHPPCRSTDSNPGAATPVSLYNLYNEHGTMTANPYTLRKISNQQRRRGPVYGEEEQFTMSPLSTIRPTSNRLQLQMSNAHLGRYTALQATTTSSSTAIPTDSRTSASSAQRRRDRMKFDLSGVDLSHLTRGPQHASVPMLRPTSR